MYLYIELWKARDAWRALASAERSAWMDKTLAALQGHLGSGKVEALGIMQNDADTPLSAGYDFAAVWRMPDKESAVGFESFVGSIGWHEYFEQVNSRGPVMEMDEFVLSHINS